MKRLTLLSATLAIAACSAGEPGQVPHDEQPVQVTVSGAQRAPALESFPASVVSERTAEIATRMSGTVQRVLVDVGAHVRRGQALIALDAEDITARVAAAVAQEELAGRSHSRVENLARDGAASQHELDQAIAALEASRAGRAEAEAQQAYAVVRAPFDGVITSRSVDPGDLAAPGRPMLSLVAPGALKVVAELPAHRAGAVAEGDEVRVRIPSTGATEISTVSRVVPALGPGSRTFRVETSLSLEGDDVIPGAYARLEVEEGGEGPRWIPEDAVVRRGQLAGVFSVEADTLRLRWVRLGQSWGDAVELLSGPTGPLDVVRNPTPDLWDGRAVGTLNTEPWTAPGADRETSHDAEVTR
jgi:RND family efflux transporter MFP subunit